MPENELSEVTIYKVELFEDSEHTKGLDDWPADGDLVRSPKYIFGEDDAIYVQVKGVGTDPETQETINNCIKVTSDSDTTGIYLDVKETGVNTNIFRNSLVAGELLYLSSSSSEGDGDKIKVVGEEVLTFAVKTNGSYLNSKDGMIDRGEYCTASGTGMTHQDSNDFESHMDTNWEKIKSLRGTQVSESSIIEWTGKSDLAYLSGHGLSSDGYFIFREQEDDPPWEDNDKLTWSEAGDWNPDTEWVVLIGCSNLIMTDIIANQSGTTNNFADDWAANTLRHADAAKSAHAIVGYRDGAPPSWDQEPAYWGTDYEISAKFADFLDTKTVKDAWIDANANWVFAYESGLRYSPLNAVAVFHDSNVSDKKDEVTRDTNDSEFEYYYIEWEWDPERADHVKPGWSKKNADLNI